MRARLGIVGATLGLSWLCAACGAPTSGTIGPTPPAPPTTSGTNTLSRVAACRSGLATPAGVTAELSNSEPSTVQLPRPSAVTFAAPESSTVYFSKPGDQRYQNIVCRAARPRSSAPGQITLVGLHIGLAAITVVAPDHSTVGRITVYVER